MYLFARNRNEPCFHTKKSEKNLFSYRERLVNEITELNLRTFCKACGAKKSNDNWIRCPWCRGYVDDWIKGSHRQSREEKEVVESRLPTLKEAKETLSDLSTLVEIQLTRIGNGKNPSIDTLEEKDYGSVKVCSKSRTCLLKGLFGAWSDNVFFFLREENVKVPEWFWDKYSTKLSSIEPYIDPRSGRRRAAGTESDCVFVEKS